MLSFDVQGRNILISWDLCSVKVTMATRVWGDRDEALQFYSNPKHQKAGPTWKSAGVHSGKLQMFPTLTWDILGPSKMVKIGKMTKWMWGWRGWPIFRPSQHGFLLCGASEGVTFEASVENVHPWKDHHRWSMFYPSGWPISVGKKSPIWPRLLTIVDYWWYYRPDTLVLLYLRWCFVWNIILSSIYPHRKFHKNSSFSTKNRLGDSA